MACLWITPCRYHAKLRSATFCGAFPGDGWSGGITSAVFAGCLPLIIMDGVHLPFENVLDYSAFSLRVDEADIPRLPAILRAVSPERVAQLRRGLAAVRARFGYASLAHNERAIEARVGARGAAYLPQLAAESDAHEDALETMMRILLYRAARRKGEVKAPDDFDGFDPSFPQNL